MQFFFFTVFVSLLVKVPRSRTLGYGLWTVLLEELSSTTVELDKSGILVFVFCGYYKQESKKVS